MDTQLTAANPPPAPTVLPGYFPSTEPTRPMRVAIVEDSAIIRSRLEEALADVPNVTVAGFADSEVAAKSLLAPGDWDLLILDLQLKQGNGLNVLRSLQQAPPQKRGQVAVFTNYAFPQYKERSMALGADYFFDKARDLPRMMDLVTSLAGPQSGAPS